MTVLLGKHDLKHKHCFSEQNYKVKHNHWEISLTVGHSCNIPYLHQPVSQQSIPDVIYCGRLSSKCVLFGPANAIVYLLVKKAFDKGGQITLAYQHVEE